MASAMPVNWFNKANLKMLLQITRELSTLCGQLHSLVVDDVLLHSCKGGVLGEVLDFITFALSACYTYCVWRRISFAAANFNTGMTAVKASGCIFWLMPYISAWFIAVIDVNDETNIVDENVEVTEDPAIINIEAAQQELVMMMLPVTMLIGEQGTDIRKVSDRLLENPTVHF
eukprot:scaffold34877_cov39-Cyclotella_meneghiniana.AAC.5